MKKLKNNNSIKKVKNEFKNSCSICRKFFKPNKICEQTLIIEFSDCHRCWQSSNTHQQHQAATQNSACSIASSEHAYHSRTQLSPSAKPPMELNWAAMDTSRTVVPSECSMSTTRRITDSLPPPWDSRFIHRVARNGENGKHEVFHKIDFNSFDFRSSHSFAILTPKGKSDKEKTTSDVMRYPEECL